MSGPHTYNRVTAYPVSGRPVRSAVNHDGKKNRVNTLRFVAKDTLETVVEACWWMGKSASASASVVYCSVWVYPLASSGVEAVSGRGSAGGGGYHKERAALEDAFTSAGVKFEAHFGGAGEAAMVRAIAVVGAFFGVEGKVI